MVDPATHRLAIVSDIHSCFRYGVTPPSFWPEGGESADHTFKFYSYLYECWTHFVDGCPPVEMLVVNGDLLHGEDRIDRGVNCVTTDYMEQAAAAVELMLPLRKKADKLYILRGTPYHDSKSGAALEWAAQELDAELWGQGRRTGYSLYLRWHDLVFCFAHHQTSGWLYKAGGADRTALLHRAAEAQGKVPHADVIVRSHLHTKAIVKTHGIWSVQTPAWTVVFPWLEKVGEHSRVRESNDIGALIACTDGGGKLWWEEYEYPPYQETVREA